MKRSAPTTLFTFLLLLGSLACSNPADDVPTASVSEPERTAAAPEGKVFTLADESTVSFVGSKITGSHEGGFHEFDGEITLVDDDPERSSVVLNIDTTSLWADNERLTGHLKSADFFDVETYPTATFTSTAIEAAGDSYTVTGNLDLHGVTRSISFPARIAVEPDRVTAQAEFSIMRFDFDIVYPGKPDDLIRDEVVIKLDVLARPQAG